MKKKLKAVIIGGGSAGLSALREVRTKTDDYLLIDPGPLGTKCARVGCMPSKALISIANDFHRRKLFAEEGIDGGDGLKTNIPRVLTHVRELRDHFAGSMEKLTEQLAEGHLLKAKAKILSPTKVYADGREIETEKIIIATGSSPKLAESWKTSKRIFTTDDLFELEDLPERIAVIGLGAIGLEAGQAINRLGKRVYGFTSGKRIGGLDSPKVNKAAIKAITEEMPLYFGTTPTIKDTPEGALLTHPEGEFTVDAVLACVGVEPNIEGLGLENLGVNLDSRALPQYSRRTMQIGNLPVFIAGDANGCRPILHEALDEGLIAGYNAMKNENEAFHRRTQLKIIFSDPEIASVGAPVKYLEENGIEYITGFADFTHQARAVLEHRNSGALEIFIEKQTGMLLGAELACTAAEHLSHQLALAIQHRLTVFDMLKMPFYHPTVEEGIRSALRSASKQLPGSSKIKELEICLSSPEEPLC